MLQVLLGTMLINLLIKVVLVVSLSILLLHALFLTLNQELLCFVPNQQLPDIELLRSTLCLIESI